MLETFTRATFAEHVGSKFRLHSDGVHSVDVELVSSSEIPGGRPGTRAPFSIVFRGPANLWLPQKIYQLEHHRLGKFDLFLVPIGPDQAGMQYEAVFN